MTTDMPSNYTPVVDAFIAQVYILAAVLLKADSKGMLKWNRDDTSAIFGENISNEAIINRLYPLSSNGILDFEHTYFPFKTEAGTDFYVKIYDKTKDYFLRTCIIDLSRHKRQQLDKLNSEISRLKSEKELLLTFDPDELSLKIEQTKIGIKFIQNKIMTNEMLFPLKKPIEELHDYVNGIERVTKIYSDIYLNIIKPIQKESKSGVRATAKWAIISIVITSIVSLIVSNLKLIVNLFGR